MRNQERGDVLKQKIAEESLPISISEMDVDSDESVKQGIEAILKVDGSIDVLLTMRALSITVPSKNWRWLSLNLSWRPIILERFGVSIACFPQMRKNRSGCIH